MIYWLRIAVITLGLLIAHSSNKVCNCSSFINATFEELERFFNKIIKC